MIKKHTHTHDKTYKRLPVQLTLQQKHDKTDQPKTSCTSKTKAQNKTHQPCIANSETHDRPHQPKTSKSKIS